MSVIQENSIFQVEILVTSGTAIFPEGLPINPNLKEIKPENGWVAIEHPFCGTDQNGMDSHTQARSSYATHKIYTLSRLQKEGCDAKLRLALFERRECLILTNSPLNINIYSDEEKVLN